MNRCRRSLIGLGLGVFADMARTQAQTGSGGLRRVGVLAPSTRDKEEVTLKPFFDEMRKLGWTEGRNITYDRAYADDQRELLPRRAAELVGRQPELIYAPPSPAAVAARQASRTVPIVFATGTDPVGTGLVASLARPGGNVTGVISVIESLAPKLLELLGETVPSVKRVGYLGDPGDPRSAIDLAALLPVAAARGLTIVVGKASNPQEFEPSVAGLLAQKVGVILTGTAFTFNMRARLAELANQARVPVFGHRAQLADAGALLAYGASLDGQLRRSAHMVDKVLKGAKPADIPIEQPTLFELVINLKTARQLGIRIPDSVLLRADRVVE